MKEQTLHEMQQAVKVKFDEMVAQKTQKDTEVEEMVIEMNRLQGEWRLLDKMRKEVSESPADPASTLPDPAPDMERTEAKRGRK